MLKSSASRAWLAALFVCCLIGALAGCFLLNRPPVASFVVLYNVDLEDGMVVDLDATTSSDPDGDAIASYMWTFGDDVEILTPLAESATVYVPVIRVRYPDEQEGRRIQLLVTDEHGEQSDVIEQTITLPHI